jgi:hypothetical protein
MNVQLAVRLPEHWQPNCQLPTNTPFSQSNHLIGEFFEGVVVADHE